MYCRHCGSSIPDDSLFCKSCGKALSTDIQQPAPPVKTSDPKGAPVVTQETELWSGARSPKSMAGRFAGAAIWAVIVVFVIFKLQNPSPWVRPSLAGLALAPTLYVTIVLSWEKLRVQYRLTTARLFKREGVLFRRHHEMELIRVDDVEVEQSLMERVLNTGTVIVRSSDATDPELRLERIDAPHDVKEMIRNASQQRRKGTVYVDSV